MRTLGLSQLCISELGLGRLWVSHPRDILGTLVGSASELSVQDAAIVKAATAWLKDIDVDALVYHVLVNNAEFSDGSVMQLCHLLYVSSSQLDWSHERPRSQAIPDPGAISHIYCAVYNATDPELSDLGTIEVRSLAGGLVRLA